MAEAARAAGLGPAHTFEGQTYHLKPLGPHELGLFEVWLESRAIGKIERQRGLVDETTYAARLAEVVRQVAAGRFSWEGTAAREAFQTLEGKKYAFFLNLLANHPDMTEERAGRMFDADPSACLAKMNLAEGGGEEEEPAEGAVPNPQAPEAA